MTEEERRGGGSQEAPGHPDTRGQRDGSQGNFLGPDSVENRTVRQVCSCRGRSPRTWPGGGLIAHAGSTS